MIVAPPLSPVQARALRFIESEVARTGAAPTLREMADALGYRHCGAVVRTLDMLVAKGVIRRTPRAGRGIEVVTQASAVEREDEAVECLRKLVSIIDADGPGSPAWDRTVVWGRQIVGLTEEP